MSDEFRFSAAEGGDAAQSGESPHAPENHLQPAGPTDSPRQTIRELLPLYFAYAAHEWNLRPATIRNYRDGLFRALKVVGDIRPEDLDLKSVLSVKQDLAEKNVGACWTRGVVNSVRSFLRFCRLVLNLDVLDPKAVSLPRIPRREVVYLAPQEIERFLAAIPVFKKNHQFSLRWLCFRSLVEVLLGTGMRITEALSLKRPAIDLEKGEARIVGKGNKERTVFFTPRALGWVKEFVRHRSDAVDLLFVLPGGQPLYYDTVRTWFSRIRRRSGLAKTVTAHIMRHTCATTLLFNGCPINHIKEILGHERLETTCRYYLGVDKAAAKEAHRRYLTF
jgi:integrase/recombinase XerC